MPYLHKLACRLALLKDAMLLLSVTALACEPVGLTDPDFGVISVAISLKSVTIQAGDSMALSVSVVMSNGRPPRPASWVSRNPAVATVSTGGTVSMSGMVKGLVVGATYIVVASGSKSDSAAIIVVAPPPAAVESVAVSPAGANVQVGTTIQLTALPKDSAGNPLGGRTVTWSSSSSAVANVNGSGLVTAVAAGSATITAASEGKSGTAALTVVTSGGLITDPTLVFAIPRMAKPAYLVPIWPSPFGTKVTRIANDPGARMTLPTGTGTWGGDARHHYSKDQPWSSDGMLLALQNSNGGSPGDIYLNGSTYQPTLGPCATYSVSDDRWHPSLTHPHERIAVSGSELMWFDVVTCTKTRSWSLPFGVTGFGMWEGNPSFDGRFAALSEGTRMFVVDMDPQSPYAPYPSQRIGPAVDITDCGLASGCSVDWASISPSGKYAAVVYTTAAARIYDVNPGTLALTPRPMPKTYPGCTGAAARGFVYDLGHEDMTLNPFDNNEDVLIGKEHCGNSGRVVDGKLIGNVVMARLRDGAITPLTNPTNEAEVRHVSTRNYDRLGWAYVGYVPTPGTRFQDEIVAVRLDGSQAVERLAHTHTDDSGCYRCEAHAVPSRDGRRVVWASNWMSNGTGGTATIIQDYVVDTRP